MTTTTIGVASVAPAPGGHLLHPIVRKLSAYGPLAQGEQAALAGLGAGAQRVEGRYDLLSEGCAPDSAVLILEGVACRYRHRRTGARQITAYLLPGDLCDPDFLHLGRLNHGVATLGACRVARVPREALASLTAQYPAVARAFASPSSPRRRRRASG